MIPRRPLGTSGADAPALGFGVSGPLAGAAVSPAHCIALIRQALDGGAALFDTAPFYGDGEAERRLGAALAGGRDTAFICTKAGSRREAGRLVKDFDPGHMARSLEDSLRRLKTDHVDAFLLHGPAPAHMTDDLFAVLEALKTAGKTRLLGVCGRGAELDVAIASRRFDLIMAPAGPAVARPALARAAAARASGMGVLGIEIMAGAAPDLRVPRRPADLWYLARAMRRRMRGDAAPPPGPPPARALEWALAGESCDCALITTTRPAHLAQNLEIARRAP